MPIEDALVKVLREHKDGMEAMELRIEMERMGYSEEEIRQVIQSAMNRGRVQLGRELRLELEAA